jgi:hypothetical protein
VFTIAYTDKLEIYVDAISGYTHLESFDTCKAWKLRSPYVLVKAASKTHILSLVIASQQSKITDEALTFQGYLIVARRSLNA